LGGEVTTIHDSSEKTHETSVQRKKIRESAGEINDTDLGLKGPWSRLLYRQNAKNRTGNRGLSRLDAERRGRGTEGEKMLKKTDKKASRRFGQKVKVAKHETGVP